MLYKMNIFSGTNDWSEILSVLKRIILNQDIINGKEIKEYEKIFGDFINSDNIFSFASGRMGLYTSLKAMGIHKDDEIILPAYTCEVVSNAIILAGVKPIYCDIKKSDFNIDVSKIESLITSKTKAIYAQHTFGQMCDIKAILAIAKKYNLYVIEDNALSLGAKLDNQYAGTFGDIGYFSTDRSKVINTGQGGMVSVNNQMLLKNFKNIYDKSKFFDEKFTKGIAITFILNYFSFKPYFYKFGKYAYAIFSRLNMLTYIPEDFIYQLPKDYPYPARLPNILAFIGISQINNIKFNLTYRKDIAKRYNNILKIYNEDYIDNEANIFLRYSFLINNRDYWEKRFKKIIDLGIWFKTPIAGLENAELYKAGYCLEDASNAEYISQYIFNLPTHFQVNFDKMKDLLMELKQSGDIINHED